MSDIQVLKAPISFTDLKTKTNPNYQRVKYGPKESEISSSCYKDNLIINLIDINILKKHFIP